MENLKLEATDYTLKTYFETSGKLLFSGISIPENIINYNRITNNWIDEFITTYPKAFNVTFDVDYLNTASTRVIVTILKKIKTYCTAYNAIVYITWYYEDDDILELGNEFSEIIEVKFNFIAKTKRI
jgi:hypothetical protein